MKLQPLNFLSWYNFSNSIICKIKKGIKFLSSENSSFLKPTASYKKTFRWNEAAVEQAEFSSITMFFSSLIHVLFFPFPTTQW